MTLARIIEEGMCIGCGLCASMFPEKLEMASMESGYVRPIGGDALTADEVAAVERVCPGVVVSGLPPEFIDQAATVDPMWGAWLRLDKAHAADPDVRYRAATGGVLTALADFLLASGRVSAILHVRPGGLDPANGTAHVSRTREDVLAAMGSRYAPADPLTGLEALLAAGERFAVIAKPCDVSALRLRAREDARITAQIPYMLSIVCGGFMPPFSMNDQYADMSTSRAEVTEVRYRGYGCPGPTRVVSRDGRVAEKSYLDLWGEGYHMPWRCKICPDGNAEAADLVAFDCWPGGGPTLESSATDPGSNAVITRTRAGRELFEAAVAAGYLVHERSATMADLDDWQPHQLNRKIPFRARDDGMRAAGHRGLNLVDMGLAALDSRIDQVAWDAQRQGTIERIAIAKHRDEFGVV